ncbi:hypothetical protein AFE_1756 [Acidithiobacillus ferrooxidans ATCC 23270]|jgi:hypothetical protein|uniref:Uncharacterized protein n=1 Tax=Acidithiobacillus ferrooxidans (strain ATCC 23270 / DSM 14882 / CIP 104768 / NCIMB 8455) TaxID=243159 RepID=B7JBL3_ACIF2|nr:hypothetical protein AFE_1756 [Acidithiobacillus ferrooxidans ATCC 23270]
MRTPRLGAVIETGYSMISGKILVVGAGLNGSSITTAAGRCLLMTPHSCQLWRSLEDWGGAE